MNYCVHAKLWESDIYVSGTVKVTLQWLCWINEMLRAICPIYRGVLAIKFHRPIFSAKHSTQIPYFICQFLPKSNVQEMKRSHLIDILESLENKVILNYMSCLPWSERWSVKLYCGTMTGFRNLKITVALLFKCPIIILVVIGRLFAWNKQNKK